ncbi:LOW QUALITY PROTEIN: hypothetical protein OSB04_un001740 [Centaurea solstitialis]|uniref:Integrase catalytic domain-containing protein n=1 Tax=Centaurea solstitialis TaxID=347529 RepID=A0AA38S3U7_9ASTR|nr:LOW QUALITY PROTEIN: hypothetical protein OSB04_un001740 [Centaurea solstitialis]
MAALERSVWRSTSRKKLALRRRRCITRGYGTLTNGKTTFWRVSYVEGLTYNLLSISQLCDKDHKVKNRHKKIILRGQRSHDVYVINMDTSTENVCFMSRASSEINCSWNKCLSHLNFKTINQLSISNLVKGLPENRFSKESLPSTLHSIYCTWTSLDLSIFSLWKAIYLVIVDEYSRYTWVFFLRAKSETPQLIISFILRMEKYNQITVRSIRRNSLELLFHSDSSAKRVAEQRNRTLIEAARSMLIDAHLPIQLWAEAVTTACYTQNRSPIVKNFKKTEELRKLDIEYFHIFGCNCYIKNDRDAPRKFDAKLMMFLAYRVFNKRRQTIEETIHVKFDESNLFSFSSLFDNNDVDQRANSNFQVPENEPLILTSLLQEHHLQSRMDLKKFLKFLRILQFILLFLFAPITSQEDIPSTSGSSKAAPLVADPPQLDVVAEDSSSTVAAELLQARSSIDQVLDDLSTGVRTRHQTSNHCLFCLFLSKNEPSKRCKKNSLSSKETLSDPCSQAIPGRPSLTRRGIDYVETFALLEAIGLFLAYAAHMKFQVFQMDVRVRFSMGNSLKKSMLLNLQASLILKHPNHVYKLNKALMD